MIIRWVGNPCPCTVILGWAAVLWGALVLTGCGPGDPVPAGSLDLRGIPLSVEMSDPVEQGYRRLARPEPADPPYAETLARYHFLSHAVNDVDPAVAVDSLLTLWAADLDNFMWIDLGSRRASILRVDPRLAEIGARPVFSDTNSAVGCFRLGRDNFRKGSGGKWWRKARHLDGELDALQRVWLDVQLTKVDRGDLRPEDGVRRLLDRLAPAGEIGGRRLEFELWLAITLCLIEGDYLDDALHTASLAEALARRVGDPYLQTRGNYWLGRVFLARQELTVAGERFQAALDQAEAHGFNWQRKVNSGRVGSVRDALGDYPAVLAVDRANLALMRATADSLNIPRFLLNIANTHRQMGQLDSCRVYQDEAIRCVDLYPHPANVARLPLMIVEYYAQVGQFARVDSLLQVALDDPVNTQVAEEAVKLHVNLIREGLEQGRPDLVQRSIAQVDSLRELAFATGGRVKVDHEADLLSAEFYAGQEEFARAGVYLDRAAATLATTDAPEARWSLLRAQGVLARQRGDLSTARARFAAGHELIAQVDNPDLQARSRFLLGSALLAEGRFAAARDLFPPEDDQTQFGGRFRTRLASQLFRGVTFARGGQADAAVAELQTALEMCSPWSPRDLVARTRLELGRAERTRGRAEAAAGHLRAAWDLLFAGDRSGAADLPEAFHGDLRRDTAEALITLYLARPEIAPGADPGRTTLDLWGRLAREARRGEPLGDTPDWSPGQLIFLVGEETSFSWAVGPQHISVRILPSGEALSDLLTPILSDLIQPGRPVPAEALGRLAEILLAGGETIWAADQTLKLVPDGLLGSVPWAALPLPRSFAAAPGALALDYGALVYQLAPRGAADDGATAAATSPGPGDRLLAVGANAGGATGLGALHQAEAEAAAIGALWPADGVHRLLGSAASWQSMAELNLGSFKAVHLASHARVHRGLPEQSYLVLSGAGGQEQLTARTVAALDLSADLVYLSCCEAAATVSGGGMVGGFVQAFVEAGAGSVIASSLGVDDEASRYLAEKVYGHWLDDLTLARALRQGQRDLRGADPRWSHPFYWAFFRIYQ